MRVRYNECSQSDQRYEKKFECLPQKYKTHTYMCMLQPIPEDMRFEKFVKNGNQGQKQSL